MELGLAVLITGVIAGGVLGALARAWSIQSRLYALENALSVVEGTLQREVKIRAAAERWNKKNPLDDSIAAALKAEPEPKQQKFWWQRYTEQKKAM